MNSLNGTLSFKNVQSYSYQKQPNWNDSRTIIQSIASEVANYLENNPNLPIPEKLRAINNWDWIYIYINRAKTLCEYGGCFLDQREPRWHFEEAKTLIEIIKNLSPCISIADDEGHKDERGTLWPALQHKIDRDSLIEFTGEIDGNVCIETVKLHSLLNIPADVKRVLTVSRTAMRILETYKSQQGALKKEQEEEAAAFLKERERERLLSRQTKTQRAVTEQECSCTLL